ncbi:MAG: CoA transferase, partial [Chitinophagales bacterium]|nr:CoA transferase [Chitinophagales bacterium]
IAESGLVHMNGNTPTLPGFQAADVAGGAYMAMHAITTALFQREKTQKGCHINVAMTDAVLPLIALPLAAQQCIQETLKPGLFELGGSLPNYNIYRCADGKYIALGALEPKFWNNFCDAVHKQEWKKCIIGSQEEKTKVIQEVANLFLSKPRDLWLDLLKSTDCCISPVNNVQEVLSYDYYDEQNMFIENQIISCKTFKTLRHPVKFNDTESNSYWLAPYLGEDTASILSSLGYEEKNIKDFKSKGLVK